MHAQSRPNAKQSNKDKAHRKIQETDSKWRVLHIKGVVSNTEIGKRRWSGLLWLPNRDQAIKTIRLMTVRNMEHMHDLR